MRPEGREGMLFRLGLSRSFKRLMRETDEQIICILVNVPLRRANQRVETSWVRHQKT